MAASWLDARAHPWVISCPGVSRTRSRRLQRRLLPQHLRLSETRVPAPAAKTEAVAAAPKPAPKPDPAPAAPRRRRPPIG